MQDQQKKPDQPPKQPEAVPLSKEQLGLLLSDFLDPLISSKPPAPVSMEQPQDRTEQQSKQDGPTLDELYQALKEGGKERVGQMMMVKGRRLIPSPQDLALAWQTGGKDLLGALMANMDGDEDGPDPEWNERRWR